MYVNPSGPLRVRESSLVRHSSSVVWTKPSTIKAWLHRTVAGVGPKQLPVRPYKLGLTSALISAWRVLLLQAFVVLFSLLPQTLSDEKGGR